MRSQAKELRRIEKKHRKLAEIYGSQALDLEKKVAALKDASRNQPISDRDRIGLTTIFKRAIATTTGIAHLIHTGSTESEQLDAVNVSSP